jgi:phenylpropionate dioxygenase-like ring-hydroxylating dioxygenase large terminal subunit
MEYGISHRWNLESRDGVIFVCKGHHEKAAECLFEPATPEDLEILRREGKCPMTESIAARKEMGP